MLVFHEGSDGDTAGGRMPMVMVMVLHGVV